MGKGNKNRPPVIPGNNQKPYSPPTPSPAPGPNTSVPDAKRLQEQLETSELKILELQGELDKLRPLEGQLQVREKEHETALEAMRQDAKTVQEKADQQLKQHKTTEHQLEQKFNTLKAEHDTLKTQYAEVQGELKARRRPADLKEQTAQLEAKKQQLEAEIRAIQGEYDQLLQTWEALQTEREALPRREAEVSTRERNAQARETDLTRRQLEHDQREKQLTERDKKLLEQERELRTRLQQFEEKQAQLDIQKADQTRRGLQLTSAETNLKTQQTQADQNEQTTQARLLQWEDQLRSLARDLKARELNAEANFATQNREALMSLDSEAKELREHLSAAREKLAQSRTDWASELDQTRQTIRLERETWEQQLAEIRRTAEERLHMDLQRRQEEAEAAARTLLEQGRLTLEQERQALLSQQGELAQQRKNLDKLRQELGVERELFAEEGELLEERVKQRAAREIEDLKFALQADQDRLTSARSERDVLRRRLDDREDADRKFGHRSPDEVLRDLEQLEQQVSKLQSELAVRMSSSQTHRLEELEAQAVAWEADRAELRRQLGEKENFLNASRTAVTELEGLRKHREALEHTNKLLQSAIDELNTKVQELTTKSEGQPIFPTCVAMDHDEAHVQELPVDGLSIVVKDPTQPTRDVDFADLKALNTWMRNRIALGSDEHKPLYFSERDLRLFLGGMAMSRLHLLQGISGTGKTSLPAAVARVLGAGSKIIPIQAGWRDRQDLLGHYNTFERRYLETPFLQALYEAQTPGFRQLPYLIVLDEVNLSRPEQYFADLISLLEQPEGERRLELISQRIEPSPKGLLNGRFLKLPDNVWFVGTANHDETTLEIADKTYDRSHVMELPRQRQIFTPEKDSKDFYPVSFDTLQRVFRLAEQKHEKQAEEALLWLDKNLRDPLYGLFNIGWGNRLERQARSFIPVIIAAGGDVGEAMDHLLATRLFRRIRDRHDVRSKAYEQLDNTLQNAWKSLPGKDKDKNSPPSQSQEVIQGQLKRLKFDTIDEEVE